MGYFSHLRTVTFRKLDEKTERECLTTKLDAGSNSARGVHIATGSRGYSIYNRLEEFNDLSFIYTLISHTDGEKR